MSTHTEQLERDAEAARQRLAATVDELRDRLTPGRALDEILAYGRDGAVGEFVRNLGSDIARNPLPITLVGAGLAWLMLARNNGPNGAVHGDVAAYSGNGHAKGRIAAAGEAVAETASGFASSVAETADATAGYLSDRARMAADTTAAAYHAAADKAQDFGAAVSDRSRYAASRANNLGRNVIDLCREQPLILAGVGIALGALLGALLPRTQTEDHLMRNGTDELEDEGAALASEGYESARSAAQHAEFGVEPMEEAYSGGPMTVDEPTSTRMPTGDERGLT